MYWKGLLVVMTTIVCSGAAADIRSLWDQYDAVLSAYVVPGNKHGIEVNLVDYAGLAEEPRFASLVDGIRSVDEQALGSDKERLAYYINAYNILTIQLILDHRPLESIRDIGNFFSGPWDKVVLENGRGGLTLDDIEHKIIRSMGEPRIHFAVNCASVSCPDLRQEAYRAAKLDRQLEEQTRQFLASEGKGLAVVGRNARVSKLFDWYESDFEASGGVAAFIAQYLDNTQKLRIRAYLPYDWALNGQQ